jgi:hypothetical protein
MVFFSQSNFRLSIVWILFLEIFNRFNFFIIKLNKQKMGKEKGAAKPAAKSDKKARRRRV